MSEPITALDLPAQELSEATRKYFAICEEKLGMVPNVLQAYTFDEEAACLHRHVQRSDARRFRTLETGREMIAVVVSSVNKCYYCLTAHGAAVRQLSGDPLLGEQLVMNFRSAALDDRQRAMLEFAEKVTEQPAKLDEADRQRLRDVGFGDRDIWDISATAAFFNMTNRVSSAIDMRPNTEYASQYR